MDNLITLEGENGEIIEGQNYLQLVLHENFENYENPEILVILDKDNNLIPLVYEEEEDSFISIQDEDLLNAVEATLEGLKEQNESIE